ncbi:hypothetical protein H9P43_008011 [Blastocladiella emersonii ATCC 22665]|nr:hypothetical protein H9P43_008011 [Blastocladiella emersonii ATCC 22665]
MTDEEDGESSDREDDALYNSILARLSSTQRTRRDGRTIHPPGGPNSPLAYELDADRPAASSSSASASAATAAPDQTDDDEDEDDLDRRPSQLPPDFLAPQHSRAAAWRPSIPPIPLSSFYASYGNLGDDLDAQGASGSDSDHSDDIDWEMLVRPLPAFPPPPTHAPPPHDFEPASSVDGSDDDEHELGTAQPRPRSAGWAAYDPSFPW